MINFRTTTLLFFLFLLAFNLATLFLCPAETGIVGLFCKHQPLFYGLLITIYFTTGGVMAFFPCSRFHHPEVYCKGSSDRKVIALTFDDGPSPAGTPHILKILEKYSVPAAFFLIGKNIPGNEKLVKQMADQGHEIGNHSFSHSNLWDFRLAFQMRKDIRKTEEMIFGITGKRTRLFRPPYGVINPMVSNAMRKLSYKVIGWSRRSLDTVIRDDDKVIRRALEGIGPGDVILLHDKVPLTGRILEKLILSAQQQGFTFASLEEIMKIKPYA